MELASYLEQRSELVNQWLEHLMPPASAPPSVLHQAMRHSLFGGGKRLRPIICIAVGETFGAQPEMLMAPACAIEFIHTYSLIHDDLPALDDDDLRRGQPSCHKKYGEAVAILAGDALLTRAFEVLSDTSLDELPAMKRIRVIHEVATAAGTTDNLIGGQVADLEAEGKTVSPAELETIHRGKTAAMIRAAARVGAIVAGAAEEELASIGRYAENIGLAFQITDDLLDVVGETERLGKSTGKDVARKKATYPAVHGIDASRKHASKLIEDAGQILTALGRDTRILSELSWFVVSRKS